MIPAREILSPFDAQSRREQNVIADNSFVKLETSGEFANIDYRGRNVISIVYYCRIANLVA